MKRRMRFVAAHAGFSVGEEVAVEEAHAAELVRRGVAEVADGGPPPVAPPAPWVSHHDARQAFLADLALEDGPLGGR